MKLKIILRNLLILSCFCLFGCSTIEEEIIQPVHIKEEWTQEENKTTQQEENEENETVEIVKKKSENLDDLKEKTILSVAELLGFIPQNSNDILVSYEPYNEKTCKKSHIIETLETGSRQWKIILCTEKIHTKEENLSIIYPKLLIESILRSMDLSIPDWLFQGMILYGMNEQEQLLDIFARECMDKPGEISQWIVGIESKDIIFPEWEGFLFLLFLEDYYGKESLLHFFSMLYENKIAWIDALLDAFKSDFETIQKNSLNFARSFMSSRYRGLWTAYKKVLKQYIDKKYRNAIPEFKKLTIQFSGNFIESNITFWLAMCYYRMERFSDALSYFETISAEQCNYLPEMYYRIAMCHYHEKHLSKAIELFQEYKQNFSYHPLASSVDYFLADCFRLQNKKRLAIKTWQNFIEMYPQHNRQQDAILSISKLCIQMGFYGLAHKTLQKAKVNDETQKLRKLLKKQEQTETPEITKYIEELFGQLNNASIEEQKKILIELGNIGKFCIPWLEKWKVSKEILPEYIEALKIMDSPQCMPLYLNLIKQYPDETENIIKSMCQLDIPANLVAKMIYDENIDIKNKLPLLLWNTSEKIREKFPNILQKLHGTEQDQLFMIEQLMLHANEEQVPVLNCIARYGHTQARCQAMKNLLVLKSPSSKDVFRYNIQDEHKEIQLIALEGSKIWEILDTNIIKKLLQNSEIKTTITILEVLGRTPTSENITIIVHNLSDSRKEVRKAIQEMLRNIEKEIVIPCLCSAFLESEKPLYYYLSITELLEQITERVCPFHPNMSIEEKKQLLIPFQK